MSKLQNQLIAMAIRGLIDKELEYYKGNQPPENDDIRKGIERAEVAISRAFNRFYHQHCQ